MNPRRLRLIGVGLTAITCSVSLWHAEFVSAEVKFFGKKAGQPATAQPLAAEQPAVNAGVSNETIPATDDRSGWSSDKQIKLNYFSKTWSEVLRDVAQQSRRQLVMDKIPPGRFSRNDWSRYSLADTLKILNRELEPKGFRILERGQHLDLVFLRDARSEYARPVIGQTATDNATVSSPAKTSTRNSTNNSNRPQRDPFIQQAVFEDIEKDDDEELEVSATPRRWIEVTLRHQTARNVSRSLYQAFEQDAELIDQGPNGLPGFVVWRDAPAASRGPVNSRLQKAAPQRIARFAVGVDTKQDRLLIDGPPSETSAIKSLVMKLDVVSNAGDRSVRLVATKRDAGQVARTLNSAVQQLAQARAAEAPDDTELAQAEAVAKPKGKKSAKKKIEPKPVAPTNPADPKQPADAAEMESPNEKAKQPAITGPLKGDVSVEELGDVLIIRGNEQDVEMVQRLIEQIGQMLAGSVPDVNVRPLKYVDSESLAELLTTVYERLNRSRGRSAQDQTQQIVVIAIGKPNAVMVLAAERDMPTVDALIDKLDQPVDPTNEFEVFRLRYAVAGQVLTAIDSFFGGGTTGGAGGQATTTTATTTSRAAAGGLRGRVKTIADSRTNSVIVQARPRDLEEVRRLIGELDQAGSQAVNQIKLIPLKSAVADEMAELLNLAIQSVISPPQQARTQQGGGGFGGFGGGGGAGAQGQVDQKLREAKSAVLQLLDSEDGEQMLESGVLSDIRINADLRTNSLVVTAPQESLALIQALVRKFDQPASLVAEIKHFTLKNADSQSVVTMLNQLFNNQQQGQGGQRGGGGNQQNQQLGLNLAGAEDASSQLIPLKFSTDVRTNSIIAVGGAEALSVVEAIILRLDASDVRQRQMLVYRLKNSPSQEVANALSTFLQGQRDIAGQFDQNLQSNFEQLEREVIVVAEPNSNSLLVSATPRYYEQMQEIIKRIDEPQQQVIIQALLVEVALDNADQFGIELGIQDSLLFDRGGMAAAGGLLPGFNFNNPLTGNSTPFQSDKVGGQGLSNFSLGRTNSDLGFGGLVLSAGSESVSVLLRALSANRTVEILSRPQIRTLDNQPGRINVGQQVPVVSSVTTIQTTGQVQPQVTREDSGIILEVTPRVTPDDRIVMQVGAERSRFDLSATGGVVLQTDSNGNPVRSPVKDVSRAVSTIAVNNEQTVVLGGLIQKSDDVIERKVPWLGDVPILGHAFRFDSRTTRRTELLIFLTPRIIKNPTIDEVIKQVEAERLHYTECDVEELHGPLFGAPQPVPDESASPNYPPSGTRSNSNQKMTPLPPLPMPNNNPKAPLVPPLSPESNDVQGAVYEQISSRNAVNSNATNSRVQPVGDSGSAKFTRKSLVPDAFRRKESPR